MKKTALPLRQIARVLSRSKSVFITVHQRPDGDALGSQIGLALALKQKGVRTYLANSDPIPPRYRFLPHSEMIMTAPNGSRIPPRFDTALILECAELGRAGKCGAFAKRADVVINMDHHLGNTFYGTYNAVDTKAPATVMLAERLRKMMGAKLTTDMATNFYVGLVTETGSFRYSNTTHELMRLASRLIEAGVTPRWIGEQVYEQFSPKRLKLLMHALQNLRVTGKVAWMHLAKKDFLKTGAREEDSEDFIEYAKSVKGVKVAVFMQEMKGNAVRASLRAKAEIPVNTVAMRFGGGGHAYAAGCTLSGVTIEQARRRILAVIRAVSRSL